MTRKLSLSVCVIMLMVVAACCGRARNVEYSEYRYTGDEGWPRENIFYFDHLSDTLPKVCDIYISVRNTGKYTYEKLWLAVETSRDGKVEQRDTLAIDIIDKNSHWIGKGKHNIFTVTVPYKECVNVTDGYQISVTHAMEPDTVKGINDIGIILLPTQKTKE